MQIRITMSQWSQEKLLGGVITQYKPINNLDISDTSHLCSSSNHISQLSNQQKITLCKWIQKINRTENKCKLISFTLSIHSHKKVYLLPLFIYFSSTQDKLNKSRN